MCKPALGERLRLEKQMNYVQIIKSLWSFRENYIRAFTSVEGIFNQVSNFKRFPKFCGNLSRIFLEIFIEISLKMKTKFERFSFFEIFLGILRFRLFLFLKHSKNLLKII